MEDIIHKKANTSDLAWMKQKIFSYVLFIKILKTFRHSQGSQNTCSILQRSQEIGVISKYKYIPGRLVTKPPRFSILLRSLCGS